MIVVTGVVVGTVRSADGCHEITLTVTSSTTGDASGTTRDGVLNSRVTKALISVLVVRKVAPTVSDDIVAIGNEGTAVYDAE